MRGGSDRWPEFYGFSVWGRGPTYVVLVEKGSIADEAGLEPGDQILEVDAQDVSLASSDEVKDVARKSAVKPPTLGVVSRIQTVEIPFDRNAGGYGFALRGSRPVLVDSVDPYGPAFRSGLRKGDALLQVNGYHVSTSDVVNMLLVADAKVSLGILTTSSKDGSIVSGSAQNGRRSKNLKAKELYSKMNHLLGPDHDKKMEVINLMKRYAEDRDVADFVRSLLEILAHPDEQQLLHEIRNLIPHRHISTFDRLVEARESGSPLPSPRSAKPPRVLVMDRTGDGNLGVVLCGHSPVVVESVEPDGSAAKVGLRPGDRLLKLNGLDVSRCSQAHLVQLLQGSGSRPTLEVVQGPVPSDEPRRTSSRGSSMWESTLRRSLSPAQTVSSQQTFASSPFKDVVERILSPEERRQLKHLLQHYKATADVEYFALQVAALLDTPEKNVLWAHLLPKLPLEHRRYCQRRVPSAAISMERQLRRRREEVISRASSAPMLFSQRDTEPSSLPHSARRSSGFQLDHLGSFKQQLEYLLTSRERSQLKRGLQNYATKRDAARLLEDMASVLDTPSKRTLWLYIIPLLSSQHQNYCRGQLKMPPSVGTSEPHAAGPGPPSDPGNHPAKNANAINWLASYDNDLHTAPPDDNGSAFDAVDYHRGCPHDGAVYRVNGELVDPAAIPPGASFLLVESEEHAQLQKQDSFDARAFRALKALDDAVVSAPQSESGVERDDAAAAPPPPPPAPPVPPAPPLMAQAESSGTVMNVKRLNWDKLEMANLEGTVWGQISADRALEEVVNFLELEDQFAMSRPKQKPTRLETMKQKKICIINQKKAYNLSILLAHLRVPIAELRDALYAMNDQIYTPHLLEQLLQFAPVPDEIEKYDSYSGPLEALSEADQFGFLMTRVAGYEQRLRAMIFKANFAEKVQELRQSLEVVGRASRELVSSRRLARVFELILAMGNFLNRGNARIGGAEAFRISSLDKLGSTKTSDGKSSLLHVLVDTVQKRYPDCLVLRKELPTIPEAARVEKSGSSAIMSDELQELKAMIQESSVITCRLMSLQNPHAFTDVEPTDIQMVLEKLRNIDESSRNPNDKFSESMNRFLQTANDELQSLFALHSDSLRHLEAMLKYFGENPKTTSVGDIFGAFSRFLTAFERAHHENTSNKRH